MSNIGNKLKEIRKQKKLTQAELAEGLINRSYISQIEKGTVTPSYKTMLLIAERLDTDISYFLNDQELNLLSLTEIQKNLKNAQVYLELNEIRKAEKLIYEVKEVKEKFFSKLSLDEQGIYYLLLGEISLFKEEWEDSILFLSKSIEYFERSGNEKNQIKSLNNLSKVNMSLSKIHDALEYLNRASDLLIANQIVDTLRIEVLLNMSICHGRINEFYSAIRLCKEAHYINTKTKKNYKSGEIFMTLGICYKKIGNLDQAKEFYLKAEQFFEVFELNFNKAGTLLNLSILSRETKEYDSAIKYIQAAKILFENLKDNYQVYNCEIEHIKMHIALQNYKDAKKMALEIKDSLPEKFKYLKKQVIEILCEICIEKEEFNQALSYIEEANKIDIENLETNLIIKKAQIHLRLGDFEIAAKLFDSYCSKV